MHSLDIIPNFDHFVKEFLFANTLVVTSVVVQHFVTVKASSVMCKGSAGRVGSYSQLILSCPYSLRHF